MGAFLDEPGGDILCAFGTALAGLRSERGLTQQQLGRHAGIAQPTISALERGKKNPTLTTIVALARAFGLGPANLLYLARPLRNAAIKGAEPMTEDPPWMSADVVIACANLVDRTGATGFEIGYVHDDVPMEKAGWYAHAQYLGARLTAENHASPSAAALALAERILRGATCKCRQPVTLTDDRPGCRWQLMGREWRPGCDAPPVHVEGPRGDVAAMHRAMEANR